MYNKGGTYVTFGQTGLRVGGITDWGGGEDFPYSKGTGLPGNRRSLALKARAENNGGKRWRPSALAQKRARDQFPKGQNSGGIRETNLSLGEQNSKNPKNIDGAWTALLEASS
jgi:hypothetical protein